MNSKRAVLSVMCMVLLLAPVSLAYHYGSDYGRNNYYSGDRGFSLDFTTERNVGSGSRTTTETVSQSGFRTSSSDYDNTGYTNDWRRHGHAQNRFGDSYSSDVKDVYSDTYTNTMTDQYSYDDTYSVVNGQVYGSLNYGGNSYRNYGYDYPSYTYNNYNSYGGYNRPHYSGGVRTNVYGNRYNTAYDSGRRLGFCRGGNGVYCYA